MIVGPSVVIIAAFLKGRNPGEYGRLRMILVLVVRCGYGERTASNSLHVPVLRE